MYPGEVLWLLLFACWSGALIYNDLRYRRVPNTLIVAGFAAQLLWLAAAAFVPGWMFPPRWTGWLMTLAGFLAAFLFLPLWGRRLMSAGDIKAIAILGLWMGLVPLVLVLVLSSLLAGLHSLAVVAVSRYWALTQRWRQVPYAMYLGIAALSVVLMPLSSPWYSWCSSWCSTAS